MKVYERSKQFNTCFKIINPMGTKKINNKTVYIYPDDSEEMINGSFVTYGGTETLINDVLTIVDTAVIETFYRPDITSLTRIKKLKDGKIYEIMGIPENIEERNIFLKFKVKHIGGKA